jgi:cytochrome c-type biogenesis protein CcmE
MKLAPNTLRIGIAVVVILGTISWLAYTGYASNKSYYVTIAGSIEQNGTHVDFVLNEYESHSTKAPSGHLLKVTYKGTEPPPDTFKDDAQALAEGTYGRDGVFHATVLQAKCASKYAPLQPGATPSAPAAPPTSKPNTAWAPASSPPASSQTAATQTAAN